MLTPQRPTRTFNDYAQHTSTFICPIEWGWATTGVATDREYLGDDLEDGFGLLRYGAHE